MINNIVSKIKGYIYPRWAVLIGFFIVSATFIFMAVYSILQGELNYAAVPLSLLFIVFILYIFGFEVPFRRMKDKRNGH